MAKSKPAPPLKTSLKKGRGGAHMPPFIPDENMRASVKLFAGFGIPEERMCLGVINPRTKRPISVDTLRKVFAYELMVGSIEMDRIAMTSLGVKVREGNMTAIIWYQKNRMGWRDFPGDGGGPAGLAPGKPDEVIIVKGGLPDPEPAPVVDPQAA